MATHSTNNTNSTDFTETLYYWAAKLAPVLLLLCLVVAQLVDHKSVNVNSQNSSISIGSQVANVGVWFLMSVPIVGAVILAWDKRKIDYALSKMIWLTLLTLLVLVVARLLLKMTGVAN